MPNVPASFQGGQGVPSISKQTTSGNGGIGTTQASIKKVLPDYADDCVTTGKSWPDLKDCVSTGGVKQGVI